MIRMQAGVYEIVEEYRNGWNQEAFKERYSDILDKYDFIVGDWGYGQLRLRGFYDNLNRKVPFEQRIAYLDEYLQEFCNFGCPFFVLQRVKATMGPTMEGEGTLDLSVEQKAAWDESTERQERPKIHPRQQGERKERIGRQPDAKQGRDDRQKQGQHGKHGQARQERSEKQGKPTRQDASGRSDKGKEERPAKERRGGDHFREKREKVSSNPNSPRDNR